MKKIELIKKTVMFSVILIHANNNYTKQEESDLSRFDNEQNYLCTETITTKKSQDAANHGKTKIISDTVTHDFFSTGETRITVTEKTIDGQTTTTTKVCSTKNPSFLTWKNGALALTTATALGLGSWAAAQGLYNSNAYNYFGTTTMPQDAISEYVKNNSLDQKIKILNQGSIDQTAQQNSKNKYDNSQAVWDALEGSDEYGIDYNARNKYTGKNIATGLTPKENTTFAPYAAAALAAGAGSLAGSAYLGSVGSAGAQGATLSLQNFGKTATEHIVSPTLYSSSPETVSNNLASTLTGQQIATETAKNTVLFSASDAAIHGGIAYANNTNIVQGIQDGAVDGAITGASFGIGLTAAQAAGLNKYSQIGAGFITSTMTPKPHSQSLQDRSLENNHNS